MSFTELLKPVIAKAHEAILVANDQPLDQTQFDLFNDRIEAFAFVVQRGANIFDPLINFDAVLLTIGAVQTPVNLAYAIIRSTRRN